MEWGSVMVQGKEGTSGEKGGRGHQVHGREGTSGEKGGLGSGGLSR